MRRWHRHFGPDRWVEEVAGYRLIGFDALLLGSGEPAEAAQADWLGTVMSQAGGRRLAWFLHRPLFLDSPQEGDTGYWSVKPAARFGLMRLIGRHRVCLVASGHLHKARDFVHEATRYVWGPSSGYLVGEMAPPMPGENRLGAVVYDIDDGRLKAEIVEVPGLAPHWIDEVVEEVYPRRTDK